MKQPEYVEGATGPPFASFGVTTTTEDAHKKGSFHVDKYNSQEYKLLPVISTSG